jgi:hypothetical protein
MSLTRIVALEGSTVIGPLVASLVYPFAANSRTSYVPGLTGTRTWRVALITPVAGALVAPLRYCHAR